MRRPDAALPGDYRCRRRWRTLQRQGDVRESRPLAGPIASEPLNGRGCRRRRSSLLLFVGTLVAALLLSSLRAAGSAFAWRDAGVAAGRAGIAVPRLLCSGAGGIARSFSGSSARALAFGGGAARRAVVHGSRQLRKYTSVAPTLAERPFAAASSSATAPAPPRRAAVASELLSSTTAASAAASSRTAAMPTAASGDGGGAAQEADVTRDFYIFIQGYDWALRYSLGLLAGENDDAASLDLERPLRMAWVKLLRPPERPPTPEDLSGQRLFDWSTLAPLRHPGFEYEVVDAASAGPAVEATINLLKGRGVSLQVSSSSGIRLLDRSRTAADGSAAAAAPAPQRVSHCWVKWLGLPVAPIVTSVAFYDAEDVVAQWQA